VNGIDYFDRGWRRSPDQACLIGAEDGTVFSYDRVRQITFRVATQLRTNGYGIGAKAAVLSYNDPLAFAVVLSIMRAGLTWIPINPRNTIAENAGILHAFDCEILFYLGRFEADIDAIKVAAPQIREYVRIDHTSPGVGGVEAWATVEPDMQFDTPHDPERIYAIQPTGGTTGFPKGVMQCNRCLENIVSNLSAVAPCRGRSVFLGVAPLTHAAGVVLQYILAQGGSCVVFSHVDRAAILDAIPRYAITHTFLPPTVIYDLMEHPDVAKQDYSSLQYFIYGASPIAPEKLRQAIRTFGPVMCQVYGQTETSMPATFLSPEDHFENGEIASLERLASCGRQTPFSRVAVLDEAWHSVPRGQVGEIAVRGQGIMAGYYKAPEATAEVLRDGWLRTGDLGFEDDKGFFFITDRKKDMIISGGFNVYSVEVENALLSHPSVRECAVVGLPHAKWGEAVSGFVRLCDSGQCDEDELIAFCKQRIGSLKAPKTIIFVESLPKSAVGKILKRELRLRHAPSTNRIVS
jgi:acyl-CoA synthetase (AMP-forming)/AMP-acid ligase II